MKRDLVQFIKDHPEAEFTIDNDGWWVNFADDQSLSDEDFEPIPFYPDHNLYGGGIFAALAKIVGVKCEAC